MVIKGDDPKGVEVVAESPHSVMEEHDNMSNE